MGIRDTSLEAYEYIKEKGILGKRQEQVLKAISQKPFSTNKQISEEFKIPINVVTPRMNELVDLGIVEDLGKVKQMNGRKAHVWKVKEKPNIKTILKLKKRVKMIRCPMCKGEGKIRTGQTTLC